MAKKNPGIISVVHERGDVPFPSKTDWARVHAITDAEIRAAALDDPDTIPAPVFAQSGLHRIVNTKKLRDRLGLTQEAFAAMYRIPVGTLRDWEQGRKRPDAPARAYLLVIEKNPQVVAEMLGPAA